LLPAYSSKLLLTIAPRIGELAGEIAGSRSCADTWRHSIAKQLLDASAQPHKVFYFLGHSDPKITFKAYYSESERLKVEDFIDVE
jgi:hypothetical protein